MAHRRFDELKHPNQDFVQIYKEKNAEMADAFRRVRENSQGQNWKPKTPDIHKRAYSHQHLRKR